MFTILMLAKEQKRGWDGNLSKKGIKGFIMAWFSLQVQNLAWSLSFSFVNMIYSSYEICLWSLKGLHSVVVELWHIWWNIFSTGTKSCWIILFYFLVNMFYFKYKIHLRSFKGLRPVAVELWHVGWNTAGFSLQVFLEILLNSFIFLCRCNLF